MLPTFQNYMRSNISFHTIHIKLGLWLIAIAFSFWANGTPTNGNLPSLAQVNEWHVEWGGRPRDPYVAPDGSIWFCGQSGNYIARFDPQTEKMTRIILPEGAHPHNLIIDVQGNVWYAGNRDAHIGKLLPNANKPVIFPMPTAITDPHTLVFNHQQQIWFTAQHSNVVGLIDPKTGEVVSIPIPLNNARPYGIVVDKSNRPWTVLFGTHYLLYVNPESFESHLVEIPRKNARPRRLAISQKNHVWYVDYSGNKLGKYDPKQQKFSEWPLPSGSDSRPYGMTIDNKDRLWIAETGVSPNRVVVFDTQLEKFISSTPIPSGGAIRHMIFDQERGLVWFGVDTGYLGNISMKLASE
ncbi:Vgb family protein [Thalassotalea fusca]